MRIYLVYYACRILVWGRRCWWLASGVGRMGAAPTDRKFGDWQSA